jgi:anthranilate synthase/aminodeoxychorismate synthase-like glutamine amidotransferase
MPRALILVVDNHDSFTFNLAQLFDALGANSLVQRADELPLEHISALQPAALVISPGPGHPRDAAYSLAALQRFLGKIPILGVCLGHQCLATVLGAQVVTAKRPVHGLASSIDHCGTHLFQNLRSPCDVGRYHSLIVRPDTLPATTHVCAQTSAGEVMAFAVPSLRAYGVQFHPESFLTPSGHQMIRNFLDLVEIDATVRRSPASTLP